MKTLYLQFDDADMAYLQKVKKSKDVTWRELILKSVKIAFG
jgi:hypothetical protein